MDNTEEAIAELALEWARKLEQAARDKYNELSNQPGVTKERIEQADMRYEACMLLHGLADSHLADVRAANENQPFLAGV